MDAAKFKRALERFALGKERYSFCLFGRIGRGREDTGKPVSVVSKMRVIVLDKDMVCALEGASERECFPRPALSESYVCITHIFPFLLQNPQTLSKPVYDSTF